MVYWTEVGNILLYMSMFVSTVKRLCVLKSSDLYTLTIDPTTEKSSKLLNKKAEAKAGEASLEISSSSKERVDIATDVGVKASSTLSETVNVSSSMPNETVGSSSASGTSKKPTMDELIEDKSKASIQHGSSHQKRVNPPLDRIRLETLKGTSTKSGEHETNPFLAY
ncbi:uncharacterized protein LOC125862470 [Solanum stenotomum]|uniref:uncharacterized protein LOC125862470 n=1 Tax=Solanum stenotomum TaxID=172797 RepID=UPI0020D0E332|nr:uncharacterized protein LOC125862470 [Solanum stenotomum]